MWAVHSCISWLFDDIFSHFSSKPYRDGSGEGSQYTLLCRINKIITGLRGLVVKPCADSLTLDISPLWFEPGSGHMRNANFRCFFSGYSGFYPNLINDRLDISAIFLKGP